jgi:hypothetical protein
MMRALIITAVLATAGVAHAYPQFQLAKGQTCSECHLSPAGGGLNTENGLNVIQSMSSNGDDPTPFYGNATLPDWFRLGGDVRAAAGYYAIAEDNADTTIVSAPGTNIPLFPGTTPSNTGAVLFPMQAEVYANALLPAAVSLHVTAGLIDPEYNNDATIFASREHWAMWQQNDGPNGLFIRAGRFMPVFGLRFAEHVDYDRRYGGTPLYGEAYGLAFEEIQPSWEVHATGFVHDPWQATTELGDGATLYAEGRILGNTSIGVEGKYDHTNDDWKMYGGITAKHWCGCLNLLLQGEVQVIHQQVNGPGFNDQIVGYAMATEFLPEGFMIDLGIGEYEPDVRVKGLTQQVADLNVHWFATSHLEFILTNRLQTEAFGEGGGSSGYSLLQLHYRI